MKKFAFGFCAVLALGLGLASTIAPASAANPAPSGIAAQHGTDISAARYVVRRSVVRRGPVCTTRTVVRRGPHGRRVVTKSRVCR